MQHGPSWNMRPAAERKEKEESMPLGVMTGASVPEVAILRQQPTSCTSFACLNQDAEDQDCKAAEESTNELQDLDKVK